jgi:U3 small nucleolar RNA-associated protein 10
MSTQTSLSRQLQRLKVPQTSAQKERKGSVSFLYDFVESKSIDNDMHYAIAISGLNQLIQIEPNIERFTQTLFSESSKTLDRALQSREANHDLDQEIQSFLFSVVSNYFLLVATHKTIEWLIYRYRVNEYNVEALIACVMPYHETRLFARLIQTCPDPKVETNKWFWLKPIQISGSPLPKTTLITHCISDTGFLRFICDYMIRSLEIEPKGNSFSPFFTSTLINVIQRNTSEAIVSIIMSYVMKGIKSKNDFFKKASYCITAHLCTRITFDKKVINKILSAIAKKSKSPLSDEILIMLSIMDRFQHLDSLPLDLIKSIDEKSLIKTHNSYNIDNLNACLLKSLINYCIDFDMKDKLMYLLNELNLSPLSVQTCIQTISLILKEDDIQIPIDTFSKVLSLIERRYPVWFDETLSKLDSLASIAPLLGAFKYSFVKSAKVPLVIGLNHFNESIRKEAINHLVKNFDILLIQKDESTISTIKSVLIDLFKHNSPQTLISLFGLKQKMFELFSEEEMTEICQNLLISCHTKEEILDNEEGLYWYQLKNSILATYCSISCANNDSYYCFIYPYLLPLNDSDLDTLAIILDSKGSNTSNILDVLWQKCKSLIEVSVNERDVLSITTMIIDEMANYYIERHDLISDSIFVQTNRNVYNLKSCVLSVLILSRINSVSKDDNIRQKCGNIIITLIELIMKCTKISKPKSSLESYKDFLHNCLKNLRRNRISLSNIIFIINSLINSIDSSIRAISQSSVWFWHKEFVSSNNYYYNLFNLMFNNSFDEHKRRSSAFREILLNFVKIFFGYIGFDFFAALWANNENLLLQIRSLAVSSNLGQSNCPVNKTNVLSLLISMHSPLSNARELAIDIAKRISIGNSDQLLLHCLEHSESIKSDENQISYAIAKWFKSGFESKSTKELTNFNSLKKEWIEWIRDEKTPDYIKSGIVLLLNKCENAFVSQILIAINSYLDITSPNVSQFKIIESLLSIYCETDIFQNVVSETDIVFSFFIKSLRTKHTEEIAVNLINKDLFESLTCKEAKISLMKQLLEMIINHNNKVAKKKFKKLLNDGNLISSLLEYLIPINGAIDSSKTSKRMRTISQTEFSLESNEWKMFIISLEVIQSKKSIKDISILVKSLFEYLKMTFIMESKSSLEYLRQLLLSSLINCMKQSEDEIRYVQIESVIDCLRESQQRETQKIALILISSVANNFKKQILDYVITIFTFIGTNLLHCDDQYTIQIVFDTMEAIIPILLNDVKDTKDSVINVFVDSLPDIPSHRRVHLFRKLLNMLGEKDHLWLIFMKIVERTLNKSKVEKQTFFSLAVALCSQCDISVQIDSLNHIMQVFSTDFVDERRILSKKKRNLSESDRKIIAYNLAQVLLQVVSSQEFIITTTNSEWNNISQSLSTFLHSLIALIVKFTVIENESVFKDANNHRRRIRNILYQILMRVCLHFTKFFS